MAHRRGGLARLADMIARNLAKPRLRKAGVSPVRIGALLVRSRNGINEPCQVRIQTS